MIRNDLLDRLQTAERLRSRSKLGKAFRMPLRLVLPPLLKASGSTIMRRATTFFGRSQNVVLPEPVSEAIWKYGFFEEDVSFYILMCLSPGNNFIDVGGHFGFFSMLGAEVVGEDGLVVTFEPMPKTRALLQENISKRAAKCRHSLVPAAAGREAGKMTFTDFGLVGSAYATSTHARTSSYREEGRIEVDVVSVDEIVTQLQLSRVDLIKIDAENAEAEVLAGAQNTIERFKPSLILETGDCQDALSKPVIESLIQRGYKAYEFSEFQLHEHKVKEAYAYQNLLMIHGDS